jgi:hypothetical protein
MPLGEYLGRRDAEHVSRWHAAMMAGSRRAPRCDGVTRTGAPCQGQRLYGSRFCIHHTRGVERDRVDEVRLARACKAAARANNAIDRAKAVKTIRNIQRRSLHRAWLNHPETEGSSLELSQHEEERVRSFLRDDLGLDIEAADAHTRRPLTPRALDRARWAGYLQLKHRIDPDAARRRIVGLLRDERRYWARRAGP